MIHRSPSHSMLRWRRRRGHVAVEFAMVVPLVFLFFFAAIEFVRLGILRHVVDNASYEAARCVVVPGANVDEAEARANEVLATFGLRSSKVTVTPDPIRETTSAVTVRVEALVDNNSWVLPRFSKGKKLISETTLLAERPPAVQIASVSYDPPATGSGSGGSTSGSTTSGGGSTGGSTTGGGSSWSGD